MRCPWQVAQRGGLDAGQPARGEVDFRDGPRQRYRHIPERRRKGRCPGRGRRRPVTAVDVLTVPLVPSRCRGRRLCRPDRRRTTRACGRPFPSQPGCSHNRNSGSRHAIPGAAARTANGDARRSPTRGSCVRPQQRAEAPGLDQGPPTDLHQAQPPGCSVTVERAAGQAAGTRCVVEVYAKGTTSRLRMRSAGRRVGGSWKCMWSPVIRGGNCTRATDELAQYPAEIRKKFRLHVLVVKKAQADVILFSNTKQRQPGNSSKPPSGPRTG